jgi:hypothetical protein
LVASYNTTPITVLKSEKPEGLYDEQVQEENFLTLRNRERDCMKLGGEREREKKREREIIVLRS